MPANRSQIHINKLEAFAEFAADLGYERQPIPPASHYEVLRLKRAGDPKPLIFYRRTGTDHLTVQDDGDWLCGRFIKHQRQQRRP